VVIASRGTMLITSENLLLVHLLNCYWGDFATALFMEGSECPLMYSLTNQRVEKLAVRSSTNTVLPVSN
jgi:hypothetical protein